jgi:colanic acid/amylovoran biosynthesis glycosyltransferase
MTVADAKPVSSLSTNPGPVFPLAYFAGAFPLGSETFVYREVRGLRALGWPVVTVSLHEPPADAPNDTDLLENRFVVYSASKSAIAKRLLNEIAHYPLNSLRTLGASIADALWPEEKTPLPIRLKLPAQALAAISLAPGLRSLGIRHIHCHFAHSPSTLGMYAAMQMGIRWSFTGHANDLFQRRAILKKKLMRATFVACISRWHKQWYEWVLPDRKRKYEVIRCGVDVNGWHPTDNPDVPSGPLSSSASFGTMGQGEGQTSSVSERSLAQSGSTESARPIRILTVCRLVEKKGVDNLLRAAAMLIQRGRPAELSIAGDGPDRQRLEKLASDLNSSTWLRWLGAVQNTRVRALLAEVDIFALPCRDDARGDRDGIPVVLIEAMACGIPVLSGDLPSIRELIEQGVTGLLVDGNSPAAIADKLNMLATDLPLRHQLAIAGRRRVEEEFSLPLNLERLQDRFRRAARR